MNGSHQFSFFYVTYCYSRRYLRLWETETGRYTELKKDDLLRNLKAPMPDLIEHPKPPKAEPEEGDQSGDQSGG